MTAIFSGSINYVLTPRCNLKCGMCGLPKLPEPLGEFTTDEVFDCLNSFPFCRYITLTGGEIFVRQDIAPIVEAATQKASTIVLATNGTMTSKIKELCLGYSLEERQRIDIVLSLDGATPETHDQIRGVRGAWRHTVETIQMLKALGVPRQANMVIQSGNYLEIWDTYRFCQNLGIKLGFQNRIPRPEFSQEQVRDVYDQLKLVWTDAGIPGFEFYLRSLIYHHITRRASLPCARSKYVLPVISPCGDVYPCDNAPWRNSTNSYNCPELKMGNIRNKPLLEILNSSRAEEVLRRLDSEHCNECWGCSFPNTVQYLETLSEKELRDFSTIELESVKIWQRK